MKILPNLQKNASRYLQKNTVKGRYERHMDGATASGIAAITHGISTGTIPFLTHCEPINLTINLGLWGIYARNFGAAMIDLIQLRPIKKRAIQIKKAAKLAQKELNKKA